MLPTMLPCCDLMMARQKALEARVSIATVKGVATQVLTKVTQETNPLSQKI